MKCESLDLILEMGRFDELLKLGVITPVEHLDRRCEIRSRLRRSLDLPGSPRVTEDIAFGISTAATNFTITTENVTEWPPKPKPTRGEEIAEVMIAFPESRKKFADLIDKAIAEEREACAKFVERIGESAYDKTIVEYAAGLGDRIRQRGVA